MKIAVWHNLASGGAKRALYDQVRGLLARGHAVEAWSPPSADKNFLPLSDLIPEHELPLGTPRVSRPMRWFAKLVGSRTDVIARLNAMADHARYLMTALNSRDFDLLFAAPCQWFHVPAITHGLKIPSAVYLQEPFRALYEPWPTLPWVAEDAVPADARTLRAFRHILGSGARIHPLRVQAREESQNIRRFQLVLVNSRFSRESVLKAYGVDSTVCYLGVDTERFTNHCGPRDRFVMSVGQFSFHKNPEFVIRAVAMSRMKPMLRWIANTVDKRYLDQMTRLAQQLGVALDVQLNVPEHDLVRQYQTGLALVYAPRLEPFGFAPLEANACGMPVIALAEGGIRETIIDGENGILVDTVSEMANQLDRLMRNPELGEKLGQQGASSVRARWTATAAVRRLEAHLTQLVEDARRRQKPRSPFLRETRPEDGII